MSGNKMLPSANVKRETRKVFLRLYGDVIAELNRAMKAHLDDTKLNRNQLAASYGQSPAFLSRVLSGYSGTNLRTIAAVLAMTNHRLKVEAVSCEQLNSEAELRRASRWKVVEAKTVAHKYDDAWISAPTKVHHDLRVPRFQQVIQSRLLNRANSEA